MNDQQQAPQTPAEGTMTVDAALALLGRTAGDVEGRVLPNPLARRRSPWRCAIALYLRRMTGDNTITCSTTQVNSGDRLVANVPPHVTEFIHDFDSGYR